MFNVKRYDDYILVKDVEIDSDAMIRMGQDLKQLNNNETVVIDMDEMIVVLNGRMRLNSDNISEVLTLG